MNYPVSNIVKKLGDFFFVLLLSGGFLLEWIEFKFGEIVD